MKRSISIPIAAIAAVAALAAASPSSPAEMSLPSVPPAGYTTGDMCAEGAVNGLITVSIAAVTALMAEVALPAYPILLGTGLGVGCTMRVVGERLKAYGIAAWRGGS
jgi:hypothetical protein